MTCYFTSISMAIIKRKKNNKCGEEAEERKHLCTAAGLEIAAATMENIIEIPLKILKI